MRPTNYNQLQNIPGMQSMMGSPSNNSPEGYLGQIPDILKQYYNPYVNAGLGALGTVQGQYQNLINDPTALLNQLGSKYTASPGYQYNVDQATGAANRAAAAGGMLGSPAEQAGLAKTVSGLASQDYNQYLSNALGMYGMGLSGMGGLNQMGYGASTGLAGNLSSNLMSQAQMKYAQQQNQAQQQQGLWGSIGGLASGLASIFL